MSSDTSLITIGKECRLIEDYAPNQFNCAFPYGFVHLVRKKIKLLPDTIQKIEEAWKSFRDEQNVLNLAQSLEGIGYVNTDESGEFIDLIVQGQVLGQGASHKIYQGYSLKMAKFVALKVVTGPKELDVLRQIKTHGKNVKKAYQIYDLFPLPKENAWLSVDKSYEGTLTELIFYKGNYDPINIAFDLTTSLNFLISKIEVKDITGTPIPYSHRDIKTDNILITKKAKAVLADFNACGYLNGSPLYMSPDKYQLHLEVQQQKPHLDVSLSAKVLKFSHDHSQAADIWALGLVFGHLFARNHRELPFPSIQKVFEKANIDFCAANDETVLHDIQLLANSLSDRKHQDFVVAIIPHMLQFDPEKRISAEDLETQITRFKDFVA